MTLKVFLNFVIVSSLLISSHAFWWGSSSTTESPIQAVKPIPLGYFRTYTYQPVGAASPYSFSILGTAANPFSWPTKLPSAPMVSGARYELYPLPSSTEQTKPTTTTTTTTTSTAAPSPPPPPPPPPTQPPLPAQDRMATAQLNSANSINIASKYYDQTGAYSQYQGAMYNRRSLPYYQQPGNMYRPYPYPDYSMPNSRSTVQFVPCMCPISVASSPSNDLAERRTLSDGEQIVLLESTDDSSSSINTAENIVELGEEVEKKSNN